MCQFLHKFHHLTVITNSIPVLTDLMPYPNITTICVGGILQNQDKALVGNFSEHFIQNFQVNKCFLGTEGFDIQKGATRSVIQKNMAEHIFMHLQGEIFLLTESAKFQKSCTWLWLPLNKIKTVITDNNITQQDIESLKNTQINLKIVELYS